MRIWPAGREPIDVAGDLRVADLDGYSTPACRGRADPVGEIAVDLRGGNRDRNRCAAWAKGADAVLLVVNGGAFGHVDVDDAVAAVREQPVQVMLEPDVADMHVGRAARLRFDQNAGTVVVVEVRVGDVKRRRTVRCETQSVTAGAPEAGADAHASQTQRTLASHIDGSPAKADAIDHGAFYDHIGTRWRVDVKTVNWGLPQSVPTGNSHRLCDREATAVRPFIEADHFTIGVDARERSSHITARRQLTARGAATAAREVDAR